MAHARQDLLTPTLSEGHRPVRLYSPTALFYTSFFGGPFAAIAFSALNSRNLDRLAADARWYALAAIGAVAWFVGSVYLIQYAEIIPPDLMGDGARTTRIFMRGFGLLLWGGFYFLHRSIHRANNLVGADPLSPWRAAIGCILAAMAIQFVLGLMIIDNLGWA